MYRVLVELLDEMYRLVEEEGIEDQALSKSVLDFLLANHLGHHLSIGGRGSDGYDAENMHYEYKCTVTEQCIFHFGGNNGVEANITHAREKFQEIRGCYYAELAPNGQILRVAYCPIENFLPALEYHIRHHLQAGQFQWHHNWDTFTAIPGCIENLPIGDPTYPDICRCLVAAMVEANRLQLDIGLFSKGCHNHVFLAQTEIHQLAERGGGADAFDDDGNYEYKITITKDWNFNFGARKTEPENRQLIREKCRNIRAAYLVQRRFSRLIRIIRIPSEDLERLLLNKERITNGNPMNLRISRADLRPFVEVPNPDYDWMSVGELRTQLRNRNLRVGGNKAELIQRLLEADDE